MLWALHALNWAEELDRVRCGQHRDLLARENFHAAKITAGTAFADLRSFAKIKLVSNIPATDMKEDTFSFKSLLIDTRSQVCHL